MGSESGPSPRRGYYRESVFGRAIPVKFTPSVEADLERTADKYNLSLSALIRRCVDSALPAQKDRLRKAAARAK